MFSSNRNIESLQKLIIEIKRYFELQKKYVQLEFVSKMAILLSALIIGSVLFLLGTIVILFVLFALASVLSNVLDSAFAGFGIVALLLIVGMLLVYSMRRKWIIEPVTRFIVNLFLSNK